jgi:hypothetical protein
MSTHHTRTKAAVALALLAGLAPAAGAGLFSSISESEKLTDVSATDFNGYSRTRGPDGNFEAETYAFGNGGPVEAELLPVADPTIDNVSFDTIAHTIAVPLAGQNYVTAQVPEKTSLLIMVFWGRTEGAINTRFGEDADLLNQWNAALMGFDKGHVSELSFEPALPGYGTNFRMSLARQTGWDVTDDLQYNRYFVILKAYDFQALWRNKVVKPLWETRFSLSERRHDFGEELPNMARFASLYFGQNSHGLVRIPPVPEGHIDIGAIESLGTVPQR